MNTQEMTTKKHQININAQHHTGHKHAHRWRTPGGTKEGENTQNVTLVTPQRPGNQPAARVRTKISHMRHTNVKHTMYNQHTRWKYAIWLFVYLKIKSCLFFTLHAVTVVTSRAVLAAVFSYGEKIVEKHTQSTRNRCKASATSDYERLRLWLRRLWPSPPYVPWPPAPSGAP